MYATTVTKISSAAAHPRLSLTSLSAPNSIIMSARRMPMQAFRYTEPTISSTKASPATATKA